MAVNVELLNRWVVAAAPCSKPVGLCTNNPRAVGGCFCGRIVCSYEMRPCLDYLSKKIKRESCYFEVINKIYLQNFLHGWVVNHEMNLMSLINQ